MTKSIPIDKLDHEHLGKRVTLKVNGDREGNFTAIGVVQSILIKEYGTTVFFEGFSRFFITKDADVEITLHTDQLGR